MFVIVDMSDNRKRLFEKYRRHDIETKRFDVKSCAPFFVAKSHREYTGLELLKETVKRYGFALFPDKEKPPQPLEELTFTPHVLPLKMLIKTAANHYGALKSAQQKVTVSVVDKMGKASDMIGELASAVRYVRVVSAKTKLYESVSQKIYERCGAVVMVTDNFSTIYGSDIILSVDDKGLENFDVGTIIVYQKYSNLKNVHVMNNTSINYAKFDSESLGVNKYRFICALYETCGYRIYDVPIFEGFEKIAL